MEKDCEFHHPINVPVADRLYRLEEDYIYCWKIDSTKYRITIPAGFTYDGASVPRPVWTISGLTPDGLIRAAALVHDWLYQFKGDLPKGSHQFFHKNSEWRNVIGKWNRKDADRLFSRIMREAGVARTKRRRAYRAVRLFGWIAW